VTHYVINPGDTVQLGVVPPTDVPPAPTPPGIHTLLYSRGWEEYGPDKDIWKHQGKAQFGFTWEQAMAYEFYEFITIGGVR